MPNTEPVLFKKHPEIFQRYRESVDLATFPRKWREDTFQNYDESDRERWYALRFECLRDHLFLSNVLEMDFQENPHRLLCEQFIQTRPGEGFVLSDLDTQIKKRMILWPRAHFKTFAVMVDITQKILNYPDVRIGFLTGSDALAKVQLAKVKRIFEQPNPQFKMLFPEYCLKSVRNRKIADDADPRAWSDELCRMGNAHHFTVPCRKNFIFPEATFTISTAKSVKSGAHFDMIYVDDLVNDQNYKSIAALEKCYQNYLDFCPLLEISGFIVMTGTRYSFGDTYERIQELAKKEEKETGRTVWSFSIRDCWSWGCQNCEHTSVYHLKGVNITQPPCSVPECRCLGFQSNEIKNVLFPEARTKDGRSVGFTVEILNAKRIEYGEEFFANQYENNPIATVSQTFTEALIGAQTLHYETDLPSYLSSFTFGVGDLGYVGEEDRDFSVIFICRLFQGRIYVVACEFGNWDSAQVAENTVKILALHRPSAMFFEKINGWDGFNNLITTEAMKKGIVNVPIQWLQGSHAKNAKLMRVGAVKGWLVSKRLWFYSAMKGYDILVQQLLKWPKFGRHDDFADTAGMVVAAPTGAQAQQTVEDVSTANWLRKLSQETPPDEDYYDTGCGSGFCA